MTFTATTVAEYVCVTTVAGTGRRGSSGDGGPARLAELSGPAGVVWWEGSLLIPEIWGHRVRCVDLASGVAGTVVGRGAPGFAGDDGPARASFIRGPHAVGVDGFGNILVVDTGNNCIRMVERHSGIIRAVAGGRDGMGRYDGSPGPADDPIRAERARFHEPAGVVCDSRGNFYVNDYGNNCVRRISRDGWVTTVAGGGPRGYGGDGGPPAVARIDGPYGLGIDQSDRVYVVDNGNSCIRRFGTATRQTGGAGGVGNEAAHPASEEVMETVAGVGGRHGFAGDGGPAVRALLGGPAGMSGPHAVVIDRLGRLFVADSGNRRIRMVDEDGIIRTVAGSGRGGYAGDGGHPLEAQFEGPHGLAVDPWGNLFFVDYLNHCVRAVWSRRGVEAARSCYAPDVTPAAHPT